MSAEPENLLLQSLRDLRAEIGDMRADVGGPVVPSGAGSPWRGRASVRWRGSSGLIGPGRCSGSSV